MTFPNVRPADCPACGQKVRQSVAQCIEEGVWYFAYYDHRDREITACPHCGACLPADSRAEIDACVRDREPAESELGFRWYEAQLVKREYCCAVCHAELSILDGGDFDTFLVVCPEHGNVESVGRVSKNWVSINMERAHYEGREVMQNLADLFPPEPARPADEILAELGY